jgi:hypothetical protein
LRIGGTDLPCPRIGGTLPPPDRRVRAEAGGQGVCDTAAMAGLLFRLIRILRRKYQKRQQGR